MKAKLTLSTPLTWMRPRINVCLCAWSLQAPHNVCICMYPGSCGDNRVRNSLNEHPPYNNNNNKTPTVRASRRAWKVGHVSVGGVYAPPKRDVGKNAMFSRSARKKYRQSSRECADKVGMTTDFIYCILNRVMYACSPYNCRQLFSESWA